MPIITATPFIDRSYVLVEANWADVPAATCARVLRVRVDDGSETPLRPYIAPCGLQGEYLTLSGGHALFWDTEAPLDTAFFYRTDASGVTFPDREIRDSFSRTNVDTWNTSDSLHTWTTAGGAVADYDVAAGVGTMSLTSVNINRRATIGAPDITDSDQVVTVSTPVVATGAAITAFVFSRITDSSNFYRIGVNFETAGTVTALIVRTLAGASVTLATQATGLSYVANQQFRIRTQAMGTALRIKVWAVGTPEPVAWTTTATDATFLQGQLGVRGNLNAGNTNGLPVVLSWDDYLAQVDFMALETEPMTMPSNGYFWLKDPVRPCNDRRLTTNKMLKQDCPPGSGIFFLSIDAESYASNSAKVLPTNARRVIQMARQRRDASTALTVATRTFQDRDDILALNLPGSPLLFQAAPNYGIPDRYMAIETVAVARGLPDHRHQPRIINMPYDTVDRPVGTTQGICGSRFMDLCDIYATWDEMAAAGLSYEDLITGAASQPSENFNTWDSVLAEFVDWDDVEASNADWNEVLGGGP